MARAFSDRLTEASATGLATVHPSALLNVGNGAVARLLAVQRCGTETHPGCACEEEEETHVSRLAVQRDPQPGAAPAPVTGTLPANAADTVGPPYSALPLELRQALARSVGSLAEFGHDPQPNLDGYLNKLEAAHLAAMVQVWNAAAGLGFTAHIERFRSVYYGSSWGFEFFGNSAALAGTVRGDGNWCRDMQRFVRPEHGNTAHDWWRHCATPSGQRGLHLGLDVGAGYVNLHYDSQNPADGRVSGHVLPYVLVGPLSVLANPEMCYYDLEAVASHYQDIKSAAGRNFPAPFAEIPKMRYVSDKLMALADYEVGDPLGDHGWSTSQKGLLTTLKADLDTFDHDSRDLAVSPTGEADADSRGITARGEALQGRLISQLQETSRFIRQAAEHLGAPRSEQVHRAGADQIDQLVGWHQMTSHHADNLAGSYFSLGEKRRLPH